MPAKLAQIGPSIDMSSETAWMLADQSLSRRVCRRMEVTASNDFRLHTSMRGWIPSIKQLALITRRRAPFTMITFRIGTPTRQLSISACSAASERGQATAILIKWTATPLVGGSGITFFPNDISRRSRVRTTAHISINYREYSYKRDYMRDIHNTYWKWYNNWRCFKEWSRCH